MASLATTVHRKPSTRPRGASQIRDKHTSALASIREFLASRTCYDAFPVSFRLIVLDTKLNVKKALQCLLANGVVSAPLWNSEKSCFEGMLTVQDLIHLIQYYYKTTTFEDATTDVEKFPLENLREIEKGLGVDPPNLLHEHPSSSLYLAARRLIKTHTRRLPLVDRDSETGQEVIVSVLTQYRLLKFISINCSDVIHHLHQPLRRLGIGTYVDPASPNPENKYHPIATAGMDSNVFDVVHMFSQMSISAVPIIDEDGIVLNLYETVDVITLIRLGSYQSLELKISAALEQRSPEFSGVVICTASDSLGTLLQLLQKRRVHRLVVVEGDEEEKKGGKKGRLLGIITMSDVLRYIMSTS